MTKQEAEKKVYELTDKLLFVKKDSASTLLTKLNRTPFSSKCFICSFIVIFCLYVCPTNYQPFFYILKILSEITIINYVPKN